MFVTTCQEWLWEVKASLCPKKIITPKLNFFAAFVNNPIRWRPGGSNTNSDRNRAHFMLINASSLNTTLIWKIKYRGESVPPNRLCTEWDIIQLLIFQRIFLGEDILPLNLAFVVNKHKLKGDTEESVTFTRGDSSWVKKVPKENATPESRLGVSIRGRGAKGVKLGPSLIPGGTAVRSCKALRGNAKIHGRSEVVSSWHTSEFTATVSWMLAAEMGLLGQTEGFVFTRQCELHSCSGPPSPTVPLGATQTGLAGYLTHR